MHDEYLVSWIDCCGESREELYGPQDYENPLRSARKLADSLRPDMRGTVRVFRANADIHDPRAIVH